MKENLEVVSPVGVVVTGVVEKLTCLMKEEAEFEEQEILAEQERLQQSDDDYRKAMDDLHYAEIKEQEREWREG